MPKIIILNQCTIDPSYKDVDEAMRSTWQSIKLNLITYIKHLALLILMLLKCMII